LLLCLADRLLLKFLVVRQANILICPDQIIKEYATRTFGATNVMLIPYGIDPMSKPPPGKVLDIRHRLGIGEGPVILSLGHLHETRNRKELIEILPQLVRRFPRLKVIIVGDVGTRTAETLATKLGVSEHLVFTGAVPHSEVSAYLALADIEAHWFTQSHPHKSPGIAAQEAMAAGKVVVTAADPDVYGAGILRDGGNVILVKLSDLPNMARRIIEVLENEAQRRTIGQRASRMIRAHFSWDQVCERTIEVYRKVIRN
jgi:glycosyltransferase involved in cell wall biosynthesis